MTDRSSVSGVAGGRVRRVGAVPNMMRVLGALVLATGLLVGTTASGVGAQQGASGQLETVDVFGFTEQADPSPLTPGLASQRIFSPDFRLPIAASGGFVGLGVDGDVFELTEIGFDGTYMSTEVTASSPVDEFVRPLQITEDYLLAEVLTFSNGLGRFTTLPFRLDLGTGQLAAAVSSDDTSGAARMSLDGQILVSNLAQPYWARFSGGGVTDGETFADADFTEDQLVAAVSPDGRYAAVTGAADSGGPTLAMQLWLKDTTGGEDRFIDLPCAVFICEYEIGAFNIRDGELSVFLTGYELNVSMAGTTREAEHHYEVFLSDGRAELSLPVSVVSPNGRYVLGLESGEEVGSTTGVFVVRDLATGRQRSFDHDYPSAYTVKPVAISDDGLTVSHTAEIVCPLGLACVVQPTYFGSFELLPVADVTAGPAADQVLRLYRAVFGRIPDAGGFEFWMNRYRNGESLESIAAAFAESSEFADRYGEDPTDEELVAALYRNTLGRDGDAGGVAFWLDERADGMTVAALLVAFADSPENIERTGTRPPVTVAQGRVLRLYQAVLGRVPDAGGLGFWVGEYNNGMTLTEMARLFTGQEEFRELYGADPSNEELVAAVYLNVLGRPGDSGGVAFWLDRMDGGLTVAELFVSFSDSPENVEGTGTVR